ncbi:transcription factor tau 55 kDa subunit [Trichomonascus vanleenenianus]|uniref:transcription factor tau 55 kDa subunit n=1 Tax=Trichomonascus vanleenenianus TaxID=2268995 RepID=UPI003ECAD8E8
MVSTIYIARHGYRSNWVRDVPVPDPPTGLPCDPVLAKHGEKQAEEMGAYISTIEPRIQRIYSSPFYRCIQTAAPAAKLLAMPIYIENGVNEWFKPRTEGLHPELFNARQLDKLFPDLIKQDYTPLLVPSRKGETEDEIHERCIETVRRLVSELRNEPEIKTILIVTHAASKIALGRALVGDRNFEVRTGTCSIDKYVMKPDSEGEPGEWTCEYTGKTDFLPRGEEMHWSFDIQYAPGSTEDIRAREKSGPEKEKLEAAKSEEETTTVYVPIDLSQLPAGEANNRFISSQSDFQMASLEDQNPLFRIGQTVYQGSWENILGTEVLTDMEGEPFAKTRTRIGLTKGELKSKKDPHLTQEQNFWNKRNELMDRLEEITARRLEQESKDDKMDTD